MKTLQQYAEIKNGLGKFEGQTGLANYLWDLSMDGDGEVISWQEDGAGHFAARFDLTSEERDIFEVEAKCWVVVQDSQGFILAMPEARYARWANL